MLAEDIEDDELLQIVFELDPELAAAHRALERLRRVIDGAPTADVAAAAALELAEIASRLERGMRGVH